MLTMVNGLDLRDIYQKQQFWGYKDLEYDVVCYIKNNYNEGELNLYKSISFFILIFNQMPKIVVEDSGFRGKKILKCLYVTLTKETASLIFKKFNLETKNFISLFCTSKKMLFQMPSNFFFDFNNNQYLDMDQVICIEFNIIRKSSLKNK